MLTALQLYASDVLKARLTLSVAMLTVLAAEPEKGKRGLLKSELDRLLSYRQSTHCLLSWQHALWHASPDRPRAQRPAIGADCRVSGALSLSPKVIACHTFTLLQATYMQALQEMSRSQISGACAIGGSSHRGLYSQHQTKLGMDCCSECTCCLQKASDTKLDDYQPVTAFFFPGQGAQTVGMAKVGIATHAEGWHILRRFGVQHQPFMHAAAAGRGGRDPCSQTAV